ncbi:MAG: hypothetical protein ACXW4Q_04885 [Anaerolineales bacterium]
MNRVIQGNLLKFAAIFLFFQTLILTFAPAVRLQTWNVDYRWSQWMALALWGLLCCEGINPLLIGCPMLTPIYFPRRHC